MKKYTLFLLLFLATTSSLFAMQPSNPTQLIDDGEDIDIDINEHSTYPPGTGGPKRSLGIIPIRASYCASLSCIIVDFLDDIGNVVISITNHTTGEVYERRVRSEIGIVMIPIYDKGAYSIDFASYSAVYWSGYFTI